MTQIEAVAAETRADVSARAIAHNLDPFLTVSLSATFANDAAAEIVVAAQRNRWLQSMRRFSLGITLSETSDPKEVGYVVATVNA